MSIRDALFKGRYIIIGSYVVNKEHNQDMLG